jgi:predicted CopG family antitoxin
LSETTTIRIRKETRERLVKLGSKSETYDDIIQRLIGFYPRKNKGGLNN